jgi:hypothetical protein
LFVIDEATEKKRTIVRNVLEERARRNGGKMFANCRDSELMSEEEDQNLMQVSSDKKSLLPEIKEEVEEVVAVVEKGPKKVGHFGREADRSHQSRNRVFE